MLYLLICVELMLMIVVTYIAKSPNLLSYEVLYNFIFPVI